MSIKTDIFNKALLLLGSELVSSWDDSGKAAKVIANIYDSTRRAELRSNNWGFAKKRASLPQLGTTPDWGYNYIYQLPSDFIRIIQVDQYYDIPSSNLYVGEETALYMIEGGKILSSIAAPLKIIYVADTTDESLFDALFTDMFAAKLAWWACEAITQSNTKKDSLERAYSTIAAMARNVNAIERPPTTMPTESYLTARL